VSEADQPSDGGAPAAAQQAYVAPTLEQRPPLDKSVAALCVPVSEAEPCGPDLDLAGDAAYQNFFAQVEGILPTSFFSLDDGKPFDPSTIDIDGQLAAINPLLERSRDVRLLTVRARLLILKKDIAGFVETVAAAAEWLDKFWDAVHPRPQDGDLNGRDMAISALDLPTVIFPLQYAPLFENRRTGSITYRKWMVATGEVKARAGDPVIDGAAITEALADADPAALAAMRKNLTLLTISLKRINKAFAAHGSSPGLDSVSALAVKMLAFVDPHAASAGAAGASSADGRDPQQNSDVVGARPSDPPPRSISEATQALAAIADYYSHSEPSSPILPLVRQAHQLIGKSFLEIMTVLMPSQVDKAAFQIGTEQVFDLPVAKLSGLSAVSPASDASQSASGEPVDPSQPTNPPPPPRYRIGSRSQALELLGLVQLYFRHSEPSSPVPMLCERARALGERDFMGVLRDVLPKAALKALDTDK
jgi:type VI secretion system protein ImpA